MENIRPEETSKHQRENFGRAIVQAALKQFEDPKTAEEFKQWMDAREQKGESTHA